MFAKGGQTKFVQKLEAARKRDHWQPSERSSRTQISSPLCVLPFSLLDSNGLFVLSIVLSVSLRSRPPGINIRRRSGSKNRQKNESTGQAKLQTAVQSSLIVNNADTASNGQRPDETEPTEATLLLSEHLKNMSSHLSTELSHREYCQLSEQFKQQLSREISELKNKLDLISDRYNLATDFSTGPANPPPYPADPFSQLSNILPFNSFVLIPVSLTQPPVSLALNQLNQTQLKGPTQLDTLLANQSRPNSDRLPFQTSNRTAVGHQLGCSGYSSSTSFSSHYLCDDNFSRVRDLDEINQSRSLVNSIQAGSQQQQQSISTTKS